MSLKKFPWRICLVAVLFATVSAEAVVVNYAYDGAGRLTSADYGFGKCVTYKYDLNGNLLEQRVAHSLGDVIRILRVLTSAGADVSVLDGDINADGKIGLAETIYIMQTVAGIR
jgi:YD repeat-containing protein